MVDININLREKKSLLLLLIINSILDNKFT